MDPLLLSRIQRAWVIAFHILLPAFTVGRANYVAVLEGMHLATRKGVYLNGRRGRCRKDRTRPVHRGPHEQVPGSRIRHAWR